MDSKALNELVNLDSAINEMAIELIKVIKADGFSVSAGLQIFEDLKNNADLQAKLLAVAASIKNIPADVKAIDVSGAVALVENQLSFISQLEAVL